MGEYPHRWSDEWNDLPEEMRRFATHIGPTDAHALLLGPRGSGKGYLARILHELSERSGGSFVPQNCGVFTESLAEAKLFGSMKGAYTGATDSKPGLVEAAAGGTLLLDEFGALPQAIQAMFLTFLETGEFRRVGSTTVRKANVRVIAATNRDLGVAIAEGQFREDLVARMSLYYEVPPLRERRREIAGIVDRYLRANGAKCELTEDAMSRLRGYEWPGNIRQLVNVIRYCTLFTKDGLIGLDLVEDGIRNQEMVTKSRSDEMAKPRKPKNDEDMKRELVEGPGSDGWEQERGGEVAANRPHDGLPEVEEVRDRTVGMRLGPPETSWFVEGQHCGTDCGATVAPQVLPHFAFGFAGFESRLYIGPQNPVQQ